MNLQRRIEVYLRRHGVSPSRFGRNAAGDPNLVFDLKNGRELRAGTVRRLELYLSQAEED